MLNLQTRLDIIPLDNYQTVNGVNTFVGNGSKPYSINFVHEATIESSWEQLISRGTIVLPKSIYPTRTGSTLSEFNGIQKFAPFNRGDHITVYMGYGTDGSGLTQRFTGWITRVSLKIPITLTVEDSGWKLKQSICPSYTAPLSGAYVSTILNTILPTDPTTGKQYKYTLLYDVFCQKFTISKVTVMQLLDYMKKNFGYSIYFVDGVLTLGFAYSQDNISYFSNTTNLLPLFHFQRNVISDTLDYFEADEIAYSVQFININQDNSRKTYQFGDPGGELRTLHGFQMSYADIQKMANDWLGRFKFTGFRGTFTTFLDPKIEFGTAINLQDDINPQRNGAYLVKKVVVSSGINGGRQTITLDRRLS